MRRLLIWRFAAALLLFGGAALASSTAVQATTPPPADGHPVVGAWLLTVEEFPDDPPSLIVFHSDGTLLEADPDGATSIGAWEATGPSSVNLTFVAMTPANGGFAPILTIRAAGEVSADGQTFTAEFSIEFTAEGFPVGEFGPGHATGTRINVEPMGTPAGSLEDLFALFEAGTEPAGTEPADTEPAGTEPAGTEPAGTEPAGTEPADTEPVGTEPVGTEPAGTEPADTEPAGTEPVGTEPGDTATADTAPATTTG